MASMRPLQTLTKLEPPSFIPMYNMEMVRIYSLLGSLVTDVGVLWAGVADISSIGSTNSAGSGLKIPRSDHVHKGVSSFTIGSTSVYGDITLVGGTGINVTESSNTVTITNNISVLDTNSIDMTLVTGVISSDLKYQDTTSIDLDVDSSGLKATVLPAGVDHSSLGSLNTTNYTHLTATNHTDLTDGGDSTLHYHSADRPTIADTTSIDLSITGTQISGVVLPAGVDHNSLANLTSADPHTQYAILDGRAGSQILEGGTAASENLSLSSTHHGTKGYVHIQPSGGLTSINAAGIAGGIPLANMTLHIGGYFMTELYSDTNTVGSGIIARRARGSVGSPTALQTDTIMTTLSGRGYYYHATTPAFSATSNGSIVIKAAENFTSVAMGTYISFNTTPIGSTTLGERMNIANDGIIKFNKYTTNGFVKFTGTSGTLDVDTATYLTFVTPHNLLSTTHSDSVAASPVLGDLLYGDATPNWTKLTGNTTTTKKFLRQTGTGAISAVPAWDTVTSTDVGLGNVTNNAQVTSVTGTSPISSSGGTTPAISIADAVADGNTKGAAAFNATNFTALTGIINLIQNIHTAATPQFAKLSLNTAANTELFTAFSEADRTCMLFGNKTTHTNLYSTYNTQFWSSIEIAAPIFGAFICSANQSGVNNAIGGFNFANRYNKTEGTDELRTGLLTCYTSGATDTGRFIFALSTAGVLQDLMVLTGATNSVGSLLLSGSATPTEIYAGYGAAANKTFELTIPTATANNSPFPSISIVKNLTGTANVCGGISFSNSASASSDKRLANIAVVTDGATNSGRLSFGTNSAGTFAEQFRITKDGYSGFKQTAPVSYLETGGSFGAKVTALSANTTLSAVHFHAEVTTGSVSDVTITLPVASGCTGRIYIITKVDSGTKTVIIDGNASETINGSLTQTLAAQWESITIQCDGASWTII